MRRPVVALASLVVVVGTVTPVLGQVEPVRVERPFEDPIWNAEPSQTNEVAEQLGLVDLRTLDLSRTHLGPGFAGKGIAIEIPSGGFRGFGPFDRLGPFDDATQAPDEVWFRYHIRLTDWNAASTGKLPGLAGIYSSSARGCIRSTESQPGWSARGMFGPPGTQGASEGEVPIGTYLYHVDQAGDCGDSFWWGSLEQGRWQCIEGHVRMNTPGENDGVISAWLDGDLEFRRRNIQFRRKDEVGIGVRHMWHNVYFGGSWPTPNPLSLEYDEVVVSSSGRIGCLPPFTDVADTIHAHSIIELHALGYLFGCDYRKACPARLLTRGEAAAFMSRILDLPGTKTDYFTDDNGSTFEGVINRLAAAGLAKGCNPPDNTRYCPDRPMTRAEFATVMVRVLDLPEASVDPFTDDDGHWAEEWINRFAEAGLTSGCGSDRFCPDRELPRDEAAAFLYRSLDMLRPLNVAVSEPPSGWPPEGQPPDIPVEEQD